MITSSSSPTVRLLKLGIEVVRSVRRIVLHLPRATPDLDAWRRIAVEPKSLIEAAACGHPIVTTDMPGCREIGRDAETRLLVPARDAGALAAAISRLADDPQLRARLGAAGRVSPNRKFSDARVAAATLILWRAVLADGTAKET